MKCKNKNDIINTKINIRHYNNILNDYKIINRYTIIWKRNDEQELCK